MNKQLLTIGLASVLSMMAMNSYAAGADLSAAIAQLTAATKMNTQVLQQMPQQTAAAVHPDLQAVQDRQTQIWNHFMQWQADTQFTGPAAQGEDHEPESHDWRTTSGHHDGPRSRNEHDARQPVGRRNVRRFRHFERAPCECNK